MECGDKALFPRARGDGTDLSRPGTGARRADVIDREVSAMLPDNHYTDNTLDSPGFKQVSVFSKMEAGRQAATQQLARIVALGALMNLSLEDPRLGGGVIKFVPKYL
ncbi:unnamed protein product [Boreogadus saida]